MPFAKAINFLAAQFPPEDARHGQLLLLSDSAHNESDYRRALQSLGWSPERIDAAVSGVIAPPRLVAQTVVEPLAHARAAAGRATARKKRG